MLVAFRVFPRIHQPMSARLRPFTHGMDVDEKSMLILVRIKSIHVVQQLWVAVEEVRLGDEHRSACGTKRKVV